MNILMMILFIPWMLIKFCCFILKKYRKTFLVITFIFFWSWVEHFNDWFYYKYIMTKDDVYKECTSYEWMNKYKYAYLDCFNSHGYYLGKEYYYNEDDYYKYNNIARPSND